MKRTLKSYIEEIETVTTDAKTICLDEVHTEKFRKILKEIEHNFGGMIKGEKGEQETGADKTVEEWSKEEKEVTLTNGQWNTLTTYILMTTKYREREVESWEELAERGCMKCAASNAEFMREMIKELEVIRKEIDGV